MLAARILLMTGAAFTLVSSSPVPQICVDPDGSLQECNPGPITLPASTTGYACNPPIVDAANAPLPYTFRDATPDQKAVNRRIEKAMGRGECTYTDSQLQSIYDTFGSDLASVYPPTDYINEERIELKAQKACFVSCVDAKDQPSIDWCNANGCPIVVSRVSMDEHSLPPYVH